MPSIETMPVITELITELPATLIGSSSAAKHVRGYALRFDGPAAATIFHDGLPLAEVTNEELRAPLWLTGRDCAPLPESMGTGMQAYVDEIWRAYFEAQGWTLSDLTHTDGGWFRVTLSRQLEHLEDALEGLAQLAERGSVVAVDLDEFAGVTGMDLEELHPPS